MSELSALLFDMMEALHSPLCAAWATPHVWLYVIKHYITAIKEVVDENVNIVYQGSYIFINNNNVFLSLSTPTNCQEWPTFDMLKFSVKQ